MEIFLASPKSIEISGSVVWKNDWHYVQIPTEIAEYLSKRKNYWYGETFHFTCENADFIDEIANRATIDL